MTERQADNVERVNASVASLIAGEYPSEGSPRAKLVSLDAVVQRRRRFWKWALLLPVPAMAAAMALLYVDARPLTLAVSGAHLSASRDVVGDGKHDPALRFSDGTEVALSSRSDAQIRDITARGASVVLRHGRATASVVHRPRARWLFWAGPFQIDVVGTKFSVDWHPGAERLELTMHNGKVRVSGPLVPAGTFLTQGQRLLVSVSKADLRITNIDDVVSTRAPVAVAEPPVAPPASAPSPRVAEPAGKPPRSHPAKDAEPLPSDVAQLVAQGSYAQALRSINGARLDLFLAKASSSDLSALAEAARYEQKVDVARASLLAQRKRFPRTRASAEAAFHLGRLAEDVDNMPERAASWFALYLKDEPTGRFASEGLGRQMVATSRMGDRSAARTLADQYLNRFPQGTYANVARKLAGPNL